MFKFYKKGDVEIDFPVWWIMAIIAGVVIIAGIIILGGNLESAIGYIRDLFRFN